MTGAAGAPERAALRRAVAAVLAGERAGPARVEVTLLSSQRMRALNRRTFGHDRATDVIAFGMRHASLLVADVYLCRALARRAAAGHGLSLREELQRLAIHGTLHALGHEHPPGGDRVASPMWRRQERYLAALRGP